MNPRHLFVGAFLFTGILIAALLGFNKIGTTLDPSYAPAFELLGEPLHGLNRLVTKTLPLDDLDESELGEVLRAGYDLRADESDLDSRYVNDLLSHLQPFANREFAYRAYMIDDDPPNAVALPGGVILISRGLLRTLRSEAEILSVLAHELGHIEQGHCFEAVRFELLARKLGSARLGEFADFAWRLLAAHSYSKNIEDEADEFAYRVVLAGAHDPRGVAWAFQSLLDYQVARGLARKGGSPALLRDYLSSHPPLEHRAAKFLAMADHWWRRNPDQRRYRGTANLVDRTSYFSGRVEADEWTTAATTAGPS